VPINENETVFQLYKLKRTNMKTSIFVQHFYKEKEFELLDPE